MTPSPAKKFFVARHALVLAAATALASVTLNAAPQPAPFINPTGAPRAASAGPKAEGLEGLDDRALAAELSGRGISSLLDYYFKANHIPESEQSTIKTFGALNELNKPDAKISYGEKLRRVKDVADGIDAVLPSIKDPVKMMSTAATLIEFGVNRDVNNIEYWGEDPVTQAHLKPLADAVVKLLDAASKTAGQQATALEKNIKGGPSDPIADRWEKLDVMSHTAAYNKNMSVYFACLAQSAKDPARKSMAEAAIAALGDFDNDSSGVQARVRTMIAKLQMVSGNFKEAKTSFSSLYTDKSGIVPAPNPFEQYEARYFAVVTDILSKNLAAARTDKAALDAWQGKQLPALLAGLNVGKAQIDETTKGLAAAGKMLQWRLHVLEGEQAAPASADKKKADDAAEAVLLALRADRPDLAPIIDEQLVKRMPANKVIDDKMAPSLLLALRKKGVVESYKTDAEKPDPTVINKSIEAAQFIIHRKDRTGITPQQVDEASLSIALLQDRLGKKVPAANAYLDYAAEYYKSNPNKATQALDRAGFLVFDLRKQQPNTPDGFADLYARFLPIAINPPFNHKDLAYAYAEQLRGLKRLPEALKFLRMVPKDDPFYPSAQYKQMLVLSDLLDTRQDAATHKQTVAELTQVAEAVRKVGENPKDQNERSRAVSATLILADLARIEEKKPARTLEVLTGFEDLVKGLPAEADLLRGMLIARVNAYMGLGKTNDAVQQLTRLLQTAKGDEGIILVRQLLDQLDKEFARAVLAHDTERMRVTAKNEAQLTNYLVEWSNPKTQKDPKISQFYYKYAVYDARTQRLAGSLAEDPAERKKLLDQAEDRYKNLESKDMHDRFMADASQQKLLKEGTIDLTEKDASVSTGLALTQFDLGDYKAAKEGLEFLIANKKLGTPENTVIDPQTGEASIKPNDLYWEATSKFLRSGFETTKQDPKTREVIARSLKNVLIRGGIPERWQEDFENLRKDIAPDFAVGVPSSVPKSTTQPAMPLSPAANATPIGHK